jgi:hypothetical protein
MAPQRAIGPNTDDPVIDRDDANTYYAAASSATAIPATIAPGIERIRESRQNSNVTGVLRTAERKDYRSSRLFIEQVPHTVIEPQRNAS